jgi:two-component SAPR family response regulator
MTESWTHRTQFGREVRQLLVGDIRDLAEYIVMNQDMPLNEQAIERFLFILEAAGDCIEAIDKYSKCNRKTEL